MSFTDYLHLGFSWTLERVNALGQIYFWSVDYLGRFALGASLSVVAHDACSLILRGSVTGLLGLFTWRRFLHDVDPLHRFFKHLFGLPDVNVVVGALDEGEEVSHVCHL